MKTVTCDILYQNTQIKDNKDSCPIKCNSATDNIISITLMWPKSMSIIRKYKEK